MKIQILDRTKKKKIIEALNYTGIKKIPQLLIKGGKERIRAYSGNLSNEEIMDLWKILPIEGIGLYLGKEIIDKNGVREARLSIDGQHTLQKQITKNKIELDKEQEEEWFKGKNLEWNETGTKGSYVNIQSKETKDYIGTGKIGIDGKTLYNYLPKERRRKSQLI